MTIKPKIQESSVSKVRTSGDFVQAKRAVLSYDQRKHFVLRVYTFSGYELVFSRVSDGYWGEGTRGEFHGGEKEGKSIISVESHKGY